MMSMRQKLTTVTLDSSRSGFDEHHLKIDLSGKADIPRDMWNDYRKFLAS